MADAEAYIGQQREKGSVWNISEFPALVICGTDYAICVASTEHGDQFYMLRDVELGHKMLKRIAEDLQEISCERIYMYLTGTENVAPLTGPLRRYESASYGGQYQLSWKECGDSGVFLSYIFDLQFKIWQLIRED
jgi:hypothetical protein